jgi:hypothetical protein
MPAHSRRSSSLRRAVARRKTTWARIQETTTIAAANAYSTFDMLAGWKADGGSQQGVTIVRTHLLLTQTTACNPGDNFVWGLIRGQNTDQGVGVVGAPVPDLDPYEDWLMWEHRYASNFEANGCYSSSGGTNSLYYDLRAKRVLPELQQAYNCVIKSLSSVTYPVTIQVNGSILLTLP